MFILSALCWRYNGKMLRNGIQLKLISYQFHLISHCCLTSWSFVIGYVLISEFMLGGSPDTGLSVSQKKDPKKLWKYFLILIWSSDPDDNNTTATSHINSEYLDVDEFRSKRLVRFGLVIFSKTNLARQNVLLNIQ